MLVIENAASDDAKYHELDKFGLDQFYWAGLQGIYGYRSETPSVDDFALWMFTRATEGFAPGSGGGAHRNMHIDFQTFRNDRRSSEALKVLARGAAEDLDYRSKMTDASFRDLLDADVFEDTDMLITAQLAEAVAQQTVSAREVLGTVRTRRDKFWAAARLPAE